MTFRLYLLTLMTFLAIVLTAINNQPIAYQLLWENITTSAAVISLISMGYGAVGAWLFSGYIRSQRVKNRKMRELQSKRGGL